MTSGMRHAASHRVSRSIPLRVLGKELKGETVRSVNKPYLVVNCGALSPALIESERVGYRHLEDSHD